MFPCRGEAKFIFSTSILIHLHFCDCATRQIGWRNYRKPALNTSRCRLPTKLHDFISGSGCDEPVLVHARNRVPRLPTLGVVITKATLGFKHCQSCLLNYRKTLDEELLSRIQGKRLHLLILLRLFSLRQHRCPNRRYAISKDVPHCWKAYRLPMSA